LVLCVLRTIIGHAVMGNGHLGRRFKEKGKMEKKPQSRRGLGMAMGLAIGLPIGVAMDSIAIGLVVGLALGTAIGASLDRREKGE
jgi:hypothetical protein